MPARTNAAKSAVRARMERVFARQKGQMGRFIHTIGIARRGQDHAPTLPQQRPPDLPRTQPRRGIAAPGEDVFQQGQLETPPSGRQGHAQCLLRPGISATGHVDVRAGCVVPADPLQPRIAHLYSVVTASPFIAL